MWILRVPLLFIFQILRSDARIKVDDEYNKHNVTTQCVVHILSRYYEKTFLTFINFHARHTGILKAIHAMTSVLVINKSVDKRLTHPNKGYLIYVSTAEDFRLKFFYLVTEPTWMPYAQFLIVVEYLDVAHLYGMFDVLLRFHVNDVTIVDGATTDAFTYNPFENNGCGKRFDRIITLGKCFANVNLYPNKLDIGLRNCTIKVAATHWPPYTIDPSQMEIKLPGMDEYLFLLLAQFEHVKVNITYFKDLSDQVSIVSDDMKANGPLRWLQDNKYDAVTGGFMLLNNRIAAFCYLYGHLAYDDHFKLLVRQSGYVPGWKTFLLVFTPPVWVLLLMSFFITSILIILISRTRDRCRVIFNLIDSLLMHSCRIRRRNKLLDFILIFWIVFACLVGYHYITVLYSIAAKPIYDYQISQQSDLYKYEIKPCVSNAMTTLQELVSDKYDDDNREERRPQCKTLGKSLDTVSKSENLFTIVPYCMYYANRYKYYNERGENLLYSFRKPLAKVLYASFLYKGFPLYDKFHMLTLQVNAAGLSGKIWRDYDYFQRKRFQMQKIRGRSYIISIPWHVGVIGWLISTLCFMVEIITYKYNVRQSQIGASNLAVIRDSSNCKPWQNVNVGHFPPACPMFCKSSSFPAS